MSLGHAILGFLSIKPLSGYELKKAFDRSIQHFWPANQSQIYRTLAGLTEQGLVKPEVIEREGPLDMKRYHLTKQGEAELQRWLSTPLPGQDYREPFLIQIYFAGKLSDQEIENLIAHELNAIQERLAALFAIYQNNKDIINTHENVRGFFMSMLTLEYGILNNQAAAEWLNSVAARVRERNYSLLEFDLKSE